MGLVAVIIIFICLCTDNMVTANMSGMKMELKIKSVFSIKAAFFFSGFNALFFTLGYLLSMWFYPSYFERVSRWIGFAFLLLLGIKYMLETIEKSPSFTEEEAGNNAKMIRVAFLSGAQFLLVGYPLPLLNQSWYPQILLLLVITFAMTLLGFHLGNKSSKSIFSKKTEFIAGLILSIMAVRLIIM